MTLLDKILPAEHLLLLAALLPTFLVVAAAAVSVAHAAFGW